VILQNGSKKNVRVHVEPWGDEYPLAPGEKLRVTGDGPAGGELEVSWLEDRVVVHGWSGATVKVEQLG
jgi:hypothetical protein